MHAGASGIACGVVRNNYFQPAMRELMAHSVEIWESDPKAFRVSSHVGYMADKSRKHEKRRNNNLYTNNKKQLDMNQTFVRR